MSMPCISIRYTRIPGITEYRVPGARYYRVLYPVLPSIDRLRALKPPSVVLGIVPGFFGITWYIACARGGARFRRASVVSVVLDTVPGTTWYAWVDPTVIEGFFVDVLCNVWVCGAADHPRTPGASPPEAHAKTRHDASLWPISRMIVRWLSETACSVCGWGAAIRRPFGLSGLAFVPECRVQ